MKPRQLSRFLCVPILLLGGCGNPGVPLPPSLMLPSPVGDLQAERTGGTVALRWSMPVRTTDRVALQGMQRALVCRGLVGDSCVSAGSVLVSPGAPAMYKDALPPDLLRGELRALRYQVRLQNHRGSDAGPSNAALTLAGTAPPPVVSADGEATPTGIAIRWRSGPANDPDPKAVLLVRLRRQQVLRTGESDEPPGSEQATSTPQILEQKERWQGRVWTPDSTTDAEAVLNRSYRYSVELTEQVTLHGQLVEVRGVGAQTPVIAADDRFPPAVPAGLVSVANPQSGAIDLSWTPDTEPDLRGYLVYRREFAVSTTWERLSKGAPIEMTSWSDTTARKGVRYAYAVSAVDANGNESARSAETVEALP